MDPIQIGEFATLTGAMMQSSTMEGHFGGASGAEFDAVLAQPESGQKGRNPCDESASDNDTSDEEREGFAPREVRAQSSWHGFEAVHAPFEWRLPSGTLGASEEFAHAERQDVGDRLIGDGPISVSVDKAAEVPRIKEDTRPPETSPESEDLFVTMQADGGAALVVASTPVTVPASTSNADFVLSWQMQTFLSSPQMRPAVEQSPSGDVSRLTARPTLHTGDGRGSGESLLSAVEVPAVAASEAGTHQSAGQHRPAKEFDPLPTAPIWNDGARSLAQGAEQAMQAAVNAALPQPRPLLKDEALGAPAVSGLLPATATLANTGEASHGPDYATLDPSKTDDAQDPESIERALATVDANAGGIGRGAVEETRERRPVGPAEITKMSEDPSPPAHSETREGGETRKGDKVVEDRAGRTLAFGSEDPSGASENSPVSTAQIDATVDVKPAGGGRDDARWDLQPSLNAERRTMTEAPLMSPAHLVDTSRADVARSVGQQIAAGIAMQSDRPVELTLSPEELGRVRLTLQSAGDQTMVVSVQAERHETLDLMRRHIDSLTREFREMGYSDVSFSFSQHSDQGRAQTGAPEQTTAETGAPTASERSIAQSLSAQLQPIRISLDSDGRGLDLRI